ncbi:hypothetical protein IMY05_003G0143200 [Salix suchowensis]|nr:hypothetical protein IMY05_003G0143200 [Salix suchowensis]
MAESMSGNKNVSVDKTESSSGSKSVSGYTEWWGDRPRGEERREGGRGRKYSGGRGGGRGHKGNHRANAAQTTGGSSSVAAEGGGSSLAGLSDEQWAKLRVILGEPKEIIDKMTVSQKFQLEGGSCNASG